MKKIIFIILSFLPILSNAADEPLILNSTAMRGGENIGSFYFSGTFNDVAATNCEIKFYIAYKKSHLLKKVLLNRNARNQNAPHVLRLRGLSHSEITYSGDNQYIYNFVNINKHPKGTTKLFSRVKFSCNSGGLIKNYFSKIVTFDFTEGRNLGSSVNISKLATHIRSKYQQ